VVEEASHAQSTRSPVIGELVDWLFAVQVVLPLVFDEAVELYLHTILELL